jgi:hypothetical protein
MEVHKGFRYENHQKNVNMVNWILLVQDRDQCLAIENTVINLWVPVSGRNFLGV